MTTDDKIMKMKVESKGEIKEILFDKKDLEIVSAQSWRNDRGYARSNENDWYMHHFIMGKPPPGYVIDHIDHNGLNNTHENLRFANKIQNSQNKDKKDGVTSNYIGVSKGKEAKKWVCWSSSIYLGSFDDPLEAAKKYDTYALLKYGKDAQTNAFVKYEDINNIDIETLRCHRPERELPPNVYKHHKSGYEAKITYDDKPYRRSAKTIEECILYRDEIFKEIDEIKKKKIEDQKNQEIIRNDKGEAILIAKGGTPIVDDDKWHECMKYKWYKSEGRYKMNMPGMKGVKPTLNRFITNAKEGDKVTFVDPKKNEDYRVKNLQFKSSSEISHQANKNMNIEKTSNYPGVSFNKTSQKWSAKITKDKNAYDLGIFEYELDAANAYREKESELYGVQPKKKISYKKEVIQEKGE